MLVLKSSCTFHCFHMVNYHIYFQSPNLPFRVIINHWLKVTGVFFYCSACPHFIKQISPFVPPASPPPALFSENLMVGAFSEHHLTLAHSPDQNPPSGLR